MSDLLPVAIAALGLFGGAALGVAAAVGATAAAKIQGAPARVGIVVLAILGGGIGLVVIGGVKPADAVDLVIRASRDSDEVRLMAVLKAHYPQDYVHAQSTLAILRTAKASPAEIELTMDRIELPLVIRQLPLANITTAHGMLVVARDQARFLAKDPRFCFDVISHPDGRTMRALDARLPADLKRRSNDLTLTLLEQSITAPQSAEGSIDVQGDLRMWTRDAMQSLSPQEQAALASLHGDASDEQAAAFCHLYERLMQRMSEADEESAAEVYKAMTTTGLSQLRL